MRPLVRARRHTQFCHSFAVLPDRIRRQRRMGENGVIGWEAVVGPLVREMLVGPYRPNDLHGFPKQFPVLLVFARIRVGMELRTFVRPDSPAKADFDPAPGHVVQGCQVLGQSYRVPPGHDVGHLPDADPGRPGRQDLPPAKSGSERRPLRRVRSDAPPATWPRSQAPRPGMVCCLRLSSKSAAFVASPADAATVVNAANFILRPPRQRAYAKMPSHQGSKRAPAPLASSRKHSVSANGLRWIVLTLVLTPLPRPATALPVRNRNGNATGKTLPSGAYPEPRKLGAFPS